jgi:hypothetical protein
MGFWLELVARQMNIDLLLAKVQCMSIQLINAGVLYEWPLVGESTFLLMRPRMT